MTLQSPRSQLVLDESIIREQVLSTHNYDGRKFNTNFILSIAENILSVKMCYGVEGIAEEAGVEKLNQLEELINYEELPSHIRQLSFEIASAGLKSSAKNEHSTTIDVLRILCSYCWEDKMVLMLSAFSIVYGELSRVSRLAMPQKLEHLNQKAVVNCITSVLKLIKCVVELKQTTPSNYSTPQSIISALPIACYWIGRSVIGSVAAAAYYCDSQVPELTTSTTAAILHTFSSELDLKKKKFFVDSLPHSLQTNSLFFFFFKSLAFYNINYHIFIYNQIEQSTPYNNEREKFLWQQEPNCSLDLVVGTEGRNVYLVNYEIQYWFGTEDYIFLYGGNDINWVREFTTKFGEECNDEILQGLKKLLAYEGKNTRIEGWAVLSKGKKMVVCGHGAKILQVINEYEIWKENIATKGFDEAFKDHHEMLTSSSSLKRHSCCALEYPTTLSKISENEKCPECSYRMHKFVTFTCCHGHDIDSNQD
nr:protein SIEVE ELEMENT OCCLUSION B-like isoform X2 [Ipomoea trifida]